MKNKSLATLSPLCLALFAGSAWADLEPFSFGASEQIQHQSNLGHTESRQIADWTSTTQLSGAINEPVGRDKLVITGDVDFDRYKHSHTLDSTGYNAAAEFDWSTVGDLSGALGADSHRHQSFYGESSEFTIVGASTDTTIVKNLRNDNHVFARATLGGQSRWTIFGGTDANKRNYSNDIFRVSDEHQWSADLGTRYSTSPDLSFGVTGNYVRGEYPDGTIAHPDGTSTQGRSNFNSKVISATTQWQVGGNTRMDASLGYTSYYSDAFGGTRHFMNGSLNWVWKPPSHLTFTLSLKRSADADSLYGAGSGAVVSSGNVNGTAINNDAHLDTTYAVTAKTSLEMSADYIDRKYLPQQTLVGEASGSTRTSRVFLTAHFLPTRTTDLSCGAGRETSHVSGSLAIKGLAASYNDNYVQCTASIHFD
ncbi:hypothetical protein [Scleromatobacter humisilvae]|uniref:Uncharacterized protein n=1 Tax=Scleromatobacter humisilvae TaxID=2897159 RepID=A0A9X1YI74_9BURK|nr:hypothetical protein [Scleromatobacter humisilvae]MCK9685860.1 hypothetical protein [Scleromatobacter humisilvae]